MIVHTCFEILAIVVTVCFSIVLITFTIGLVIGLIKLIKDGDFFDGMF